MAVACRNVSICATSCSHGIALTVAVPESAALAILACWKVAVNEMLDAVATWRLTPLRAAAFVKPWITTRSPGTNELAAVKVTTFEDNALFVIVADAGVRGATLALPYP